MVACAPVPNAWPGIDHQLDLRPERGLPRRPHHQPAAVLLIEHERPVKLPPALIPVVRDLGATHLDQRATRRRGQLGQRGQLARRAVHRVLDDVVT